MPAYASWQEETTMSVIKSFLDSGLTKSGWAPAAPGVPFRQTNLDITVAHVAVCNDEGKGIYDQPVIIENRGAIVVVLNEKKEFGLVRVFRPVAKSFADFDSRAFQQALLDGTADMSLLGAPSLEIPRGMPTKGDASVAHTAAREGSEETGKLLRWPVKIGNLVWNTTFAPNDTDIYISQIDSKSTRALPPDVNEKIFGVEYFPWSDVKEKIASGEIFCGMTKAALFQADIYLESHPEFFKKNWLA
jgi:8-oxo-dGTP pyrophosphatase MutT (NUDIX family)